MSSISFDPANKQQHAFLESLAQGCEEVEVTDPHFQCHRCWLYSKTFEATYTERHNRTLGLTKKGAISGPEEYASIQYSLSNAFAGGGLAQDEHKPKSQRQSSCSSAKLPGADSAIWIRARQ